MMSQGEIEALTLAMEKAARNLEVNIMLDIVRRIKANLDIEKSMDIISRLSGQCVKTDGVF